MVFCYYDENKWNCMNISKIFKMCSPYNTADSSIKLKAPKLTQMFLVPRYASMNHGQFLSITNTHHAHPPLPHAIPPPPDCWEMSSCLDFARMSWEGWSLQDKPGKLFSFRKMASKGRGVGHASSVFSAYMRNKGSQHHAPHFTDKGRQSPPSLQ